MHTGLAPYPPIEPYTSGMLPVGNGHQVYWEEVGRADGIPALYLHGGPGSGCSPGNRRGFDPQAYRAVLMDQRGCGRSRPWATSPGYDLSDNTTDHLVADIEHLREHLGIQRWVVVGASWGVTLALCYAQRHPERVRALVLGAVGLGTRREIDWLTRDMGRVFPQEWERFVELVPADQRSGNLAAAYARLLADPDPRVRDDAAARWCAWEDTHVSLTPGHRPSPRYQDPDFRRLFSTLVTHYWGHECFLGPTELRDGMERISHIPAHLIHGRWDVSSPLDVAWELHRQWPASELVVLEEAGHGGVGFPEAMRAALDRHRQPPHTGAR